MTPSFEPEPLHLGRLSLEPLRIDHAGEMVTVLADPALYRFTGGTPPSLADLVRRYSAQLAGSGDDDELWLNWIARENSSGVAVGFVQATVEPAQTEVAWVIGAAWQGNGYATEACTGLVRTVLEENHLPEVVATFDSANDASRNVLEKAGFVGRWH